MRLVVQQVHRAFPELDRFSDEQCRRFVSAAQRPVVYRLAIGAVSLILLLAAILAGAAAGGWTMMAVERSKSDLLQVVIPLAMAAGAFPVVAAAFFVRNFVLRRRIAHILRQRGVCAQCRYNLLGLPVDAALAVVCPECGAHTQVDAALGELTIDPAGQARFAPKEGGGVAQPVVWLTPERTGRLLRRAAIVGGIVVGLVLLIVGAHELSVRQQASAARADRIGVEGLLAMVERVQPARGPGEPEADAWDDFTEAVVLLGSLQANATPRVAPNDQSERLFVDFSLIGRPEAEAPELPFATPEEIAAKRESARATRALTELVFKGCDDPKLAALLRRMAQTPRAVYPIAPIGDQPLTFILLPQLGSARQLARFNGARLADARRRGDTRAFGEALDIGLALARMVGRQPAIISSLVARSIEAVALAHMRMALLDRPDAATLDAIEAALAKGVDVPPTFPLQTERAICQDAVSWLFADPDRVRLGAHSAAVRSLLGQVPDRGVLNARLGSYYANREEIDRIFDMYEGKTPLTPTVGSSSGLLLVDALVPALDSWRRAMRTAELERLGLSVLVSIERFRLAHGRPPASLTELAQSDAVPPGWRAPIDPFSGSPLAYRLVAPSVDALGRDFLLYALGADGRDNGGASGPSRAAALQPGGSFDYIFNAKDPGE